ncbi:valine--tRNA ligase [Gracilaria domingensis]|nr:valine--tRNA ligase [Gracilaria domingensis]
MPPRYDPQQFEQVMYQWWESAGLFKPCAPNGKEPFTICMPPPNVTGGLHMGHAMFATIEDILTRYHRMRGKPTLWLPGTDHAGIATQLVVEKELAKDGITRDELGRQKFVERVWKWKEEKGDYINVQMRRLGASCDWDRARFTLEDHMSASVAEAFKRLHDQGLVYKGSYMVNWSPKLRTAVSDLEVEFSEENGKLYYFRYPLSDGGGFIPVATTRPETILGDTAVCVHPEDERYRNYVGKTVKVPVVGRDIPVIADSYVDREFGTGALKITPGHDHNDYELAKKHELPIINIMNKDATINSNGGQFEGLDRFEARKKLWDAMDEGGLVMKVEDHVNRVPRSQRGGEVVEPLVSAQWFIKMKSLAEKAVSKVRDGEIAIEPKRFEKVYFNWLEDIRDWCVSRQLWWGHRIPVWYVEERPDDYIVARDEDEARQIAKEKYKGETVTLNQETDVLDTWFSSGLWPFSTMGWPDNDAEDLKTFFPGSIMETGYDILFFWVARMIMLSVWLMDEIPFHTVYLHGLVRDKYGRKMSKTVGNVIDPLDVISSYGTDALRYTLVTGSTPGQDIPLSSEKIESNRNFANKLWNASRFIIGNLNSISDEERKQLAILAVSDFGGGIAHLPLPERYILSKLHILVDTVTNGLDTLTFGDAGRQIYEFLWDEFADWYVETAKTRFFGSDADAARHTRATLVYVMDTCLRLLHPFMPFVTEAIWHRFPRDGSHEQALIIAEWPSGGAVDREAIRRFEKMQSLVRYIRNARAEYQVDHGRRIPLTIRTDAITASDVDSEKGMLFLLTKVDPARCTIEVVEEQSTSASQNGTDDNALHLYVADNLEAIIPMRDMIDFDKERKRLEKQSQKLQKDLEGLQKRLKAPGFADKAPPAVVAKTRTTADEIDAQLANLTSRLAEIQKLAAAE